MVAIALPELSKAKRELAGPLMRLEPIVEVAMTLPLLSEARSELLVAESLIRLKALRPVNVLLSVRSEEEAAVIVTELPAFNVWPLMVPSAPARRFVPIDEVETT